MIFLTVPFAEKDQAKALGARWNAAKKKWYVPDGMNVDLFGEWLSATDSELSSSSPKMEEIGLTITGERYFLLEHDCIPWLACSRCDLLMDKKA